MKFHTAVLLPVLLLVLATSGNCGDPPVTVKPNARTASSRSIPACIEALVQGFNEGSPKKMGAAISDECEVRYVDEKGKASLGSRSRKELVGQMKGYFSHIKDPQSQLAQVTVAGRYVTAKESVSWRKGDKRLTQYSLVVFELSKEHDQISRVWYYPAQQQTDIN